MDAKAGFCVPNVHIHACLIDVHLKRCNAPWFLKYGHVDVFYEISWWHRFHGGIESPESMSMTYILEQHPINSSNVFECYTYKTNTKAHAVVLPGKSL